MQTQSIPKTESNPEKKSGPPLGATLLFVLDATPRYDDTDDTDDTDDKVSVRVPLLLPPDAHLSWDRFQMLFLRFDLARVRL